MTRFACLGKDGQSRIFMYEMKQGNSFESTEWEFWVTRVDPAPTTPERFELRLRQIESGTVQIVQINNHRQGDFIGAGIPIELLAIAAKRLRAKIRSSSNMNRYSPEEYRTPEATAMWNRLVSNGLATYCSEDDIYWLDE